MKHEFPEQLASVMECQQKQDSRIKHEWLVATRAEQSRLANYLRWSGYQVHTMKPFNFYGTKLFYVGVPFETLKIQVK